MHKIYFPVVVVSFLTLVGGCQTAGRTANFIQEFPQTQNGQKVTFQSLPVHTKEFDIETASTISAAKEKIRFVVGTSGETQVDYREDGRIADIFFHDFHMIGGGNKTDVNVKGNRVLPLIHIKAYFDKHGSIGIADTTFDRPQWIEGVGPSNGDIKEEDFEILAETIAGAFDAWGKLSGKTIVVGSSSNVYSESIKKLFVGMMAKLAGENSSPLETAIQIHWNPVLEFADGDVAVFQCRAAQNECKISMSIEGFSLNMVCDAKTVISIRHSQSLEEFSLCTATIKAKGETIQFQEEKSLISRIIN